MTSPNHHPAACGAEMPAAEDAAGPHVVRLTHGADAVDLSIVIPVYNSAEIMPHLHARLRKVLDALGMTYELVMVEDGSPDNSWQVLSALQAQDTEHIVAVQLMRNYGQHNALMCGFRHARGALVITMDDDLQHPPEEIPKLLDKIVADDLDLVYGCYDKKKHPLVKNAGSFVVNAFFRQVFRLPVTVTAFRVFRRELL